MKSENSKNELLIVRKTIDAVHQDFDWHNKIVNMLTTLQILYCMKYYFIFPLLKQIFYFCPSL